MYSDWSKSSLLIVLLACAGCKQTPTVVEPIVEPPPQPIEQFTLANDNLSYTYTPQVGGRGTAFSAAGGRNLLKADAAALAGVAPVVSLQTGHVGYNGHIVWLGPQNEWWRKQDLDYERYENSAVWPPDPYTVFANTRRTVLSDNAVLLESPPSPVTGMQVSKIVTLGPDVLAQKVIATNTRDEMVGWDIWFNTRVPADTQIVVPLADFAADLRVESYGEEAMGLDDNLQELGYFDFARGRPMTGKAFIQPSAGWIAAFYADQMFVIEFDLQARDKIHPQQGQVEIYLDYKPGNLKESLLELEVHAPYHELQSGEAMQAEERWRAWPYSGPHSAAAHLRALRERGYIAYALNPRAAQ
jgi:hypothetical protein